MNENMNVTINSINTFADYICSHVLEYLPEYYKAAEITVSDVVKNNDGVLTGLCIKLSSTNIAPNIYLNDYFARFLKGENLDDLCHEIATLRVQHEVEDFDLSMVTDFKKAKKHIKFKLVNLAWNKDFFLQDKVYTEYLDLAKVYYIELSSFERGCGTCYVTQDLLKSWNVTAEEVEKYGLLNLELDETKFQSMFDILREMMGGIDFPIPDDGPKMYVLTNSSMMFGATKICDKFALRNIASVIGDDFLIIPSSIHEVIVLPYDKTMDPGDIDAMIREINETQVSEQDRLSDHVYYCDHKTLTVHFF